MRVIAFFLLVVSFNCAAQMPSYDKIKKTLVFEDSNKLKGRDTIAGSEQAALIPDSFEVERFKFAIEQNKKVYAWQNLSSVIIFFVVILIVLTGLYLSFRQFMLAEKMLTSKTKMQTVEKGGETVEIMNASLEFSKDGVKINTAVIGLVILIISLSFLFLYLKYVYPVTIVKS